MSDVLSPRALNRATLDRQMLLRRADDVSTVQAVEHLVGLQAQAPFSPYYGLWSRLADFAPEDLAQPLLDRKVVRIVVMRGTVHLLSAGDALTVRPLTQPVLDRHLLTNPEHKSDIDRLDLEALASAARSLVEETPLTNAELAPLLAEHGRRAGWADTSPASLVHAARILLPLVQVPPRAVWGHSGQTRLTTLDSWLGRPLDPEPSLEHMVLRYLGAFGPASVADVQIWSGLTRLREIVEPLRPSLRMFRDEGGKELFDLPDAPRPDPDTPVPVRFLPDFDNLLRSHADRTRVISDDDRKRIATKNGVAPHSVLVDGVFRGTWKIAQRKDAATLSISLLGKDKVDADAVAREGERLLAFAASGADVHNVEVDGQSV